MIRNLLDVGVIMLLYLIYRSTDNFILYFRFFSWKVRNKQNIYGIFVVWFHQTMCGHTSILAHAHDSHHVANVPNTDVTVSRSVLVLTFHTRE